MKGTTRNKRPRSVKAEEASADAVLEAGPRGLDPRHPGELLRVVHLPELKAHGITIDAAAEALGMSRQNLHAITRGRRSVTPEAALRLAAYFGGSPQFWLTMQARHDLWLAAEQTDVSGIQRAIPSERDA